MPTDARLIAHSVNEDGIELLTMQWTYPLIIHNEVLTARSLWKTDEFQFEQWLDTAKSASSNRALSTKQLVERVRSDPYIPAFGRNARGMVASEKPLSGQEVGCAVDVWLESLDAAIHTAFALAELHVHKQWANRPLLPYQFITTVITGNGQMFDHLFSLRVHPSAQPDYDRVARLADRLVRTSNPRVLKEDEWHMPYVSDHERYAYPELDCLALSVARCARASYYKAGTSSGIRDDFALFNDLKTAEPPHAAPFEHQARPIRGHVRSGVYVGWNPFRQILGMVPIES